MIDGWSRALTIAAALGCGLVAGSFFAFSTFVMRALRRLPPQEGLTAMQSVNRQAPTPWFMAAIFGTAIACVAVAVSGLARWGEAGAVNQLVGSGLYLAGVVLLTIVYHVPRNDALAAVDREAAGAAGHWTRYAARWTAWNHLRTASAFAAATVLTVAL